VDGERRVLQTDARGDRGHSAGQYGTGLSLKVSALSRAHTELCDTLLQTEMALMHDAVFLFARALHRLHFEGKKSFDVQALECDGVRKSAYGFPLANFMKFVST